MSASTIITEIESICAANLPVDWSGISFTYEPEKNSAREDKTYGVGAAPAFETSGAIKAVTIEHEFFIIFQRRFSKKNKDSDLKEKISDIYDKMDLVYPKIANSKLNNSVLIVRGLAFDEPVINDERSIQITARFNCVYRKSTN